jgi:hypothetical protein
VPQESRQSDEQNMQKRICRFFTIIVALIILMSVAAMIVLLSYGQTSYLLIIGLLLIDGGLVFSLYRIIIQYQKFKK